MESGPSPFTAVTPRRGWQYLLIATVVIGVLAVMAGSFFVVANQPPQAFPVATPITIEPGSSVAQIVTTFKEAGAINSEFLLYALLLTRYSPSDIKASTYVFDKPYSTLAVATKLAEGDFTSNLVRITHREGERVTELAPAVVSVLPHITSEAFIQAALPYEGYLWPETYFVPPHYTAEEVVTLMRSGYEEFKETHREAFASSTLREEEIVIIASIIEREANNEESMSMVSGILQNRLAIGMALQTDASIEYILDKPLGELTPEDLTIDSPYNTYSHNGLPPTPIGNPGAMALEAVLYPTPSDYLFYITGNDGTFYYASTYDEHKRNIARYLK